MITLFPDQDETIGEVRKAYAEGHRGVLLRADTGWGKSYATSYILHQASQKGRTSWFTVPTDILFEQTEEAFKEAGIKYNKLIPGKPISLVHPVTICMIQTLSRRLQFLTPPDFIVFDECSHIVAQTWDRVYDWLPESTKVLGLTATPVRLNGKGFKKYFSVIVEAKPMKWLIENKRLSAYKAYGPDRMDTNGPTNLRGGDFTTEELEMRMKSCVMGKTIEHYKKLCSGKRAIVFAYSIKDSKETVEAFKLENIPAEHIDGTFSKQQRLEVLERFEKGETLVLSNVDLCIEGLSIKMIEACIMRRRTKSLGKYMQMIGRSLRYHPAKEKCVILDMVGNIEEHDLPDIERKWTLEDAPKRSKSQKVISVKTCTSCFACIPLQSSECPECGAQILTKERKQPEIVEGELKEITRKIERKQQGQAKTLEQLLSIARMKGYNERWAYHVHNARNKKRG